VDTPEAAQSACDMLLTQRVLAFDMEGARLGRHGQISLLQLATPRQVFIFDFLKPFVVTAVRPLLQSTAIIKLCYDCRCDAEALYFLHDIMLAGACDLQIAYTLMFQAPLDRYLKGFHKALSTVVPADSPVLAAKQRMKAECNFHAAMLERPLAANTLAYCASDVAYLFVMDARWVPPLSRMWLLQLTKQRMCRYIFRRNHHTPWCMAALDFLRAPCSRRLASKLQNSIAMPA
jgi:ribonuclease D